MPMDAIPYIRFIMETSSIAKDHFPLENHAHRVAARHGQHIQPLQPANICSSTKTGFSSTLLTHESFTLTPNFDHINCGIAYNSVSHQSEMNEPFSVIDEPLFHPFESETEQISFPYPLPDDFLEQGQLGFEYEQRITSNITDEISMGVVTPSNFSGMDDYSPDASVSAATFEITSSPGVSNFVETGCSRSCASASPRSLLSPSDLSDGIHPPDQNWQFQLSPSAQHYKIDNLKLMPAQLNLMVCDFQGKSVKLPQADIRSIKKRSAKSKPVEDDSGQRVENRCDYPGCHKTFKRTEHLKRHKVSFHGEGPNRYLCEFCGKDQFNRQDNLDSHRKLHARRNGRECGVVFVQGAVSIIRQEEQSKRRRHASNLSTEGKHKVQPGQLRSR